MPRRGLNTYLYAPKDDLKHRALWRDEYSASEQHAIRDVIAECKRRKLRFVYGISPGLDIQFHDPADLDHLKRRFEVMRSLGCEDFALLFDDIPAAPTLSVACDQAAIANKLINETRSLLFCPTVYCSRMMGREYLVGLGQ